MNLQGNSIIPPKERGKNHFNNFIVAVTLRVMIAEKNSEVVFPVFLTSTFAEIVD